MFRRVSLALAIAAALSPLNVQSLGLGEIQSKSYLNQTLDADIELLSVSADELDAIKISLASVEEFKKAGIDRPFVLSSLRFEPLLLPSGKVVIRATSKDPIREPFLNFLVEVNWPKGRLLREYTVLLDPPVTLPRRPQSVAAPIASATSTTRAAARTNSAATVKPGAASSPPAVTPAVTAGEYGPIQPNATLWSIAKEIRVEGASVEQVMMALLDQNPNAFINGNINLLKVGEVLRIPDQQAAQRRSREQAREEFVQQLADWQPAPEASAPEAAAATDDPPAEEGTGSEQSSPDTGMVQEAVPDAQLKLTSPSEGDAETVEVGAGGALDNTRLQKEMLLAREESAVARRESEELRSRIEELESQLEDMRRLLNVQSDELARMQQSVLDAEAETEALQGVAAVATPIDVEALFSEESVSVGGEQAEGLRPASPSLAGQGPEEQDAVAQAVEPETLAQSDPEALEQSEPETLVRSEPEPGLMDRLMSGDLMLIGGLGAAGALVMGLVGLVFRRRREESMEEDEVFAVVSRPDTPRRERDTATGTPGPVAGNPFGASVGGGVGIQDAEGQQLDALSEVDVYVAYGRYQQAEELLQEEIQRHPGRLELKYRLLDVYSATGNKMAFVRLAEEMSRAGAAAQDPESWRQLVRQGRELAPKNPLFAAPAAGAVSIDAAAGPVPAEAGPSSSGLDFDLDLEALETGALRGAEESGGPSALDEDLGTASEQGPKAEGDGGFDFDLDLESPAGAEALAQQPTESKEPSEDDLDLDKLFSFDGTESAVADTNERGGADDVDPTSFAWDVQAQPEEPSAEAEELDQGLAGIEFEDEQEETLSLDEVAGSFMPEPAVSAAGQTPEDEPEELSLEGLDLGGDDSNEVETMLDLAQIYVDMGDPDDARDILEEALKEGDQGQQQRAREILQTLS